MAEFLSNRSKMFNLLWSADFKIVFGHKNPRLKTKNIIWQNRNFLNLFHFIVSPGWKKESKDKSHHCSSHFFFLPSKTKLSYKWQYFVYDRRKKHKITITFPSCVYCCGALVNLNGRQETSTKTTQKDVKKLWRSEKGRRIWKCSVNFPFSLITLFSLNHDKEVACRRLKIFRWRN